MGLYIFRWGGLATHPLHIQNILCMMPYIRIIFVHCLFQLVKVQEVMSQSIFLKNIIPDYGHFPLGSFLITLRLMWDKSCWTVLETKSSFVGMQLKYHYVKNVMLLFVREAYYALSLYLSESSLLGNSMFFLNINQMLENTCEIMILPNHIKFNNL